jgi:cyclic pyranopterin phosphate synthase
MSEKEFTHLDDDGRVRMVDVGGKSPSDRVAVARGTISMAADTLASILDERVKKGNVLETARIAGVMAAKKTWDLIPMCHPINISHARVDFTPDRQANCIHIEAEASLTEKTGVEMEALTGVSVAALTIYDMCKAYDKAMVISDIHLAFKSGGKSGTFTSENGYTAADH